LGYFERNYVRRRGWVSAEEFAGIVALCQLLPGPTSSQVGFLIGLHRAGWRGALAAWLGFTLPSVLLMYAFHVFAPALGGSAMNSLLVALKWLTVIVVARAVWSMALRLCADVPRAVIACSGALILCLARGAWLQAAVLTMSGAAGFALCKDVRFSESQTSQRINMRAVWLIAAALALLIALRVLALETPHSLFALADIFYRSGALVFGGGHVVLPLLHDALVPVGWISDDAFLNGYGAAQLLPGPLFSVAAYLGAECAPRGTAMLGAGIAVVSIFLPGMLLAVGGRAAWSHVAGSGRVRAALAGVNAGAVGILAAALYDPVLTGALATLP
jgi:chromate transporter